MRNSVETTLRFLLGFLFILGTPLLSAQTSNQIWFATYNGAPTPSSDVSVQNLLTDGSPTAALANAAHAFVSQTNFPAFNSPYDVAVDPAMGKLFVLDNNLNGTTNEYLYSFNLTGTPAQIAASQQIIYTLPEPAADVNANVYPLLSGIALDPLRHFLYFNQIDVTTGTNSYLGRLDLTSSVKSNIHVSTNRNPLLQTFHVGQIPGQGPISIDATNVYLGVISRTGNSGVYTAPRDGAGPFSQLVSLSANNAFFTNGLVSGVASDSPDHLVYYLTWNAGQLNLDFDLRQNALWVYDAVAKTSRQISSGYPGYPDNLTIDPANRRYYFTLGRDGTGTASHTNYQGIYTGQLDSTNPPTLLYPPSLSGQDLAGQLNAGNVSLQGIFVTDAPILASVPAAANTLAPASPLVLAAGLTVTDFSSTFLMSATVSIATGYLPGDLLAAATNGTYLTASYDRPFSTLNLSGYDTLANYQQVLRTVAFSSTNATLNSSNTVRNLVWRLNDGLLASAPTSTALSFGPLNTNLFNHLTITSATNGWSLHYLGNPSQLYVVQSSAAVKGPWTDLSPVLTADSTGAIIFLDQTIPRPTTHFYRVRPGP